MPSPTISVTSCAPWRCPKLWNTSRSPRCGTSSLRSAQRSCEMAATSPFSSQRSPSLESRSPRSCGRLTVCGWPPCRHDEFCSRDIHIADRTGVRCAGRGTPQCPKWPLCRASDRKISPMKKGIAMQTNGSWMNLRAIATGATVLGNWRSHLGISVEADGISGRPQVKPHHS